MRNTDPFEDLLRSLEENLRGGSDAPPPQQRGVDQPPAPRSWRWLWVVGFLLLIYLVTRIFGLVADLTWFKSVAYTSVVWTRLWAMVALFAGAAVLFLVFYIGNVVLARWLSPYGLNNSPLRPIAEAFGLRVTPVVVALGGVFALVLGMIAMGNWEDVLLFLHRSNFGVAEPVFGADVGFFVFALPILEAVRGWLMLAVGLTLAAVVVVSGVLWQRARNSRWVLVQLGVLAAILLLLLAWNFQLSAYNLVYSQRGAVYGAGFADANATLPALRLMVWLTLAVAVAVVIASFLGRGLRPLAITLALWVAVAVGATMVYPGFVQRFRVGPNESNLEQPYIEQNIRLTRHAFDLDDIDVQSYNASKQLSVEGLLEEPETLLNIRLWDYRPLLQTYNQVQALRQYYEFNDVDIDRYIINGEQTQVMIAARELLIERLSEDAQTWVNQKLVYTHGYGVAASPVSLVTRDGLPTFYLKDLPPQGLIEITSPQIYFGERTDSYVVGGTDLPEFDYPKEDGNVTTSYSADEGIPMSWWNRFLFAIHLRDLNLVLNGDISADSRLLFRRNIVDRTREIAPFLVYDGDPYIVISEEGRLFWMHDAYTSSSRFPYSTPLGRINYIRNSVKVLTDAYNGNVTFYISDEEDPIIRGYAGAFPELFRPISEMPEQMRRHVRYPIDIFSVQAEVYRLYHMTDPTEFYNQEDVWAWPQEIFEGSSVPMEPYYVLMQLPGSDELSYVTILPFTPANRENMVAWMAVQNNVDKYGDKVVYNFGKDSLFFGPKQIEGRIDQDPAISAQLTLWNQQGSNVIRGNLLVFPIAESLLYVEPIYLQAQNGRIPELKRVIVATADEVVMGVNLGEALAALFGARARTSPTLVQLGMDAEAARDGAEAVTDSGLLTVDELILRANETYVRSQERLREGDWAGYGDEMEQLGALLESLASTQGVTVTVEPAALPEGDATGEPQIEPAPTLELAPQEVEGSAP